MSEKTAVETFADGKTMAEGSVENGLKHGPRITFNRAGGVKATVKTFS